MGLGIVAGMGTGGQVGEEREGEENEENECGDCIVLGGPNSESAKTQIGSG